jgi:tetraacyldisaccharide 4'-kinase
MSAPVRDGLIACAPALSAVAWCARRLEQGSPRSWLRLAARLYAAASASRSTPPMPAFGSSRVIGVGSMVLGGAGKTPVAIEIAADLRSRGHLVAFVGHAYHAQPRFARRVAPHDDLAIAGDDALVAATSLQHLGVPVWVAPSRIEAISAAAANRPDFIVVDGLTRSSPNPGWHATLVVDSACPLGSGWPVPAGDLRLPPEVAGPACDEVVIVQDCLDVTPVRALRGFESTPVRHAWIDIAGAVSREMHVLSIDRLRCARIGLMTFLARPSRVLASLHRRGIHPVCHWVGRDHGTPRPWDAVSIRALARRFRLDGWIATPKCAAHLRSARIGAPVWTLDVRTRLDPCRPAVLESRPCAPHVCSPSC